jgi:uncharacterized membrane protein
MEGRSLSPALTVALLWVGFALTHMLLSSTGLRPRLVAAIGDRGFQGVYSLIALALFVPLCWVYFGHKHAGPLLWSVSIGPVLYWTLQIAMGLAFVLLFAGVLAPSASAMNAEKGEGAFEPRGVHFITRHAVFMAIGLFGLVHLIPNGYASDVAFFGGFPVFVVVGSIHQDRRKLATEPGRYRAFYEATPFLPFTGRSTLRGLREISPIAIALGIVSTILVRRYHGVLFGG